MTKTFIQKLMSDKEGRKLYFREDLIFEITEAICRVMADKQVTKAELSRLAGVSKSNITQLLSGDHNMRLTTVADLLYTLGSRLRVSPIPIDIDSIASVTTSLAEDQWVPADNLVAAQPQRPEIAKDETQEFTQAA